MLKSPVITDLVGAAPAAPISQAAGTRKAALWPWAVSAIVIVIFVGVVVWHIFAPKPDVFTDNAYVRVHYATIAPRVAGQVVKVFAQNDDEVKAGQVLVELDERDFKSAVAAAEASLARDRALVANAAASLARQGSVIEQARTQVTMAEAQLGYAQIDAKRYDYLATTGSGTVKTQLAGPH
ncbi:biotin/lipoyl-binding protein [Beijerinckia sp. L45]|uniref:biotin/lipoyl-binding protein n=1 Tax=Beijerinckia sp. L45 TaxID=1641855 RepID=UPI00131C5758|nr:biotin/lipoyl-binding protein [Beijerinckia sp. L45]